MVKSPLQDIMNGSNLDRRAPSFMRTTILLVVFFALVAAGTLKAQDATFTAEVETREVQAGQQFEVSFVFSGTGSGSPSDFVGPDFSKFVVISGPNTQQSFQFINGLSSVALTYTYVLYARDVGSVTIGAASVNYKGKKYSTNPLKITVTKGKPSSQSASPAVQIGDNILLRAFADRERVRLGEQVTITWKLYTRVGMSISRVSKLPTFEGAWAEDFELPKQPALVNEVYEGKPYRVATLKQSALFPSQSGRLRVSPMEIVCAVQVQSQRRSNDPFDQFFNDSFFRSLQTSEVEIASNQIALTVDRLPDGAPEGFGNAVGSYTFDASIDKQELKAGEAVTLKVTVAGTGNIKLLTMPRPTVPGDIEVFEPTLDESIKREGGKVSGSKSAEYVLVPRNAGTRSIEPMTFSFFDPSSRSYRTLRSKPFSLTVSPGRELAMGINGVTREDVQLLGQDIRFIKLQPGTLMPAGTYERFGLTFLLGLILPPIAFVGAVIYRKRMEKVYGDLPSLRFERAGREASKRLKTARQLLSQGNAQKYHEEVLRALTEYLEQKLRLSKATLAIDQVRSLLETHKVSQGTVERVQSVIERAEFARYAPGADSASARKELLDSASQAIDGVEKEFRS